ncbi:UNVERIFIED_CONTAM: hypothetical protein GTU68_040153 [Idotea baltica]|nr:hypothetical protein [Idotea baltica]
MPHLRKSPFS